MEFLAEYGLFLAKTVTFLLAAIVVIAVIAAASQKQKRTDRGHIEVRNLNDAVEQVTNTMKSAVFTEATLKLEEKAEKKRQKEKQKKEKQEAREGSLNRKRLFVLDFDGDVQASETDQLREAVTAVLSIATPEDEVLLRLESPG
ncbi:MAG: protease SohB, partial [Pseudomonadales bacterium]|nr:protease SohB [Pseudomonadales bacterium]